MTNWLIDTNVLSELRRPRPDANVVDFISSQPLESMYVSVVTFAEIRYGIELLPLADKRMELNDWLRQKLRPMFGDRALAIDEDVMLKWRLLIAEGRKHGHTYSEPDLLIAATALHHGLVIVSRDTSEYEMARVEVVNPWLTRA